MLGYLHPVKQLLLVSYMISEIIIINSKPIHFLSQGCFGGSSESTASTVTAFSTIGTTESKNVTKRPQGDSNTLLIGEDELAHALLIVCLYCI